MGKQLHYGGPQTSHPFCLLEMRFPSISWNIYLRQSLCACMCVFSFPICLPWTTPGRQNQPRLLQQLCQMVSQVPNGFWWVNTVSVLRDSLQRFLNLDVFRLQVKWAKEHIVRLVPVLLNLINQLYLLQDSCLRFHIIMYGSRKLVCFKCWICLFTVAISIKKYPFALLWGDLVNNVFGPCTHDVIHMIWILPQQQFSFSFLIWQSKTFFYTIYFLWHQGDVNCKLREKEEKLWSKIKSWLILSLSLFFFSKRQFLGQFILESRVQNKDMSDFQWDRNYWLSLGP